MKLTKVDREILFKKYDGHCAYCGCELPERWHADLIVDPIRNSRWNFEFERWEPSGIYKNKDLNSIDNRNPCCKGCDVHKGNKTLEEFRNSLYDLLRLVVEDYGYYKILSRFGMLQETGQKVRFFFETYERKELTKHPKHSHYWVENELFCESFQTIRGMRYNTICHVQGIPDCENCSEDMVKYIQQEFL